MILYMYSKIKKTKTLAFICLLCLFILCNLKSSAQFTAGNVVVLQAGDGSATLANTGNQIVLKEFTPLGAPAFSVAISSTLNPLIISGSATSEGALTLSSNGKYLVFGGYATNWPYGSSVSAATSSSLNRGVGIVNALGNYTRVATNASFYSTSNIRAAASDGLDNYWSAGGTSGTGYFGTASPSVLVQNANTNTRFVSPFSGDLYFSTGSGTQGVYRVGSGLPTTSGQTNSLIINTSTSGSGSASCFAFYFNPSMTICYIADDRSFANGGGVQKWTYSGGTWSLAYVLNVGGTAGARGVVADFSGADPMVFATTDEGSANRLVAINDLGSSSTATTLASSTQNTLFRGLAFAPTCLAPEITSVSSGTVCAGEVFTLTPSLIGTGPLSYTWTGLNFFLSNLANPTLTANASGVYSLNVSNLCGQTFATHSVFVNPLPALTVNYPTICNGGTVTLFANGASTYSWNTSATTSTLEVSPALTTNFTVTGVSAQGCIFSATTSVIVVNSLSLTVNSPSVCPYQTTTLQVSGATNYTWTTGDYTSATVVNPNSSTTYTVVGTAPGCPSPAFFIASVIVYAEPTIVVNSSSICTGNSATLAASGGMNYQWSNQQSGPLNIVSPTLTTVYTVTASSLEGCFGSSESTVVVNALPTATLTLPLFTVCINGGPQTLTGTPQGGFFSGAAMSSDQFIPSAVAEGTYALTYKYTDENNCEDTDSDTVTVISCTAVSVSQTSLLDVVSVYPIPATHELQISDSFFKETKTIEIFNALGVKCQSLQMNEGRMLVDISHYAPGIYFLKMEVAGSDKVLKFIKE